MTVTLKFVASIEHNSGVSFLRSVAMTVVLNVSLSVPFSIVITTNRRLQLYALWLFV